MWDVLCLIKKNRLSLCLGGINVNAFNLYVWVIILAMCGVIAVSFYINFDIDRGKEIIETDLMLENRGGYSWTGTCDHEEYMTYGGCVP